ncbi:MAG TPA: PKD domain-containing protein, partial [Candidatus Deferrimicrobium sp.]|nr:PKD domain-containing protein [Candidatus Deferrimicrobium sp.]
MSRVNLKIRSVGRSRILVVLLIFLSLTSFLQAFEFSPPCRDVIVCKEGYNVKYKVFDSFRGIWQEGVFYLSSTSSMFSRDGVVAVCDYNTAEFVVYDPIVGFWKRGSFPNFYPKYCSDIITAGGVVAIFTVNTLHFAAYDPTSGNWNTGQLTYPDDLAGTLLIADGVVILCKSGKVYYAVYDPNKKSWVEDNFDDAYSGNTIYGGGVVACYKNGELYSAIYDPIYGYWMKGNCPIHLGTCFSIYVDKSTIKYISYSDPSPTWQYRGYDHNDASWHDGPTIPLAYFAASKVSAINGKYWVYFNDISLGANSYSWNFGDGITSNLRTPFHTYTSLDIFEVTQYIVGPGGYDSYTKTVKTDTTPPTGSIIINSGNAKTTSTSVNLNISATDNSGTVSNMRFSNDNSTWSVWELYSPNKSWTLSPGYGIKTVYIQFEDKVGNISASFKDTIELAPYITVISPNGGETWLLGGIQNIKWAVCDVNNNIKILLLKNSTVVGTIAGNINPSSGSFPWAVGSLEGGNSIGIGSGYQISIVELNTNKTDISNSSFAIVYPSITVLSPNGNEILNSGSSQIIKWKSMGLTGSIELTLWKNDVCVGTIAAAI